jgi:hypothetical protein
MALDVLSLPLDIPWRHLQASQDMMAGSGGFDRFPFKWRSSISMFFFQPEIDSTRYPNDRLLYFKVVFSITGYQAEPLELPVRTTNPDEWRAAVWSDFNDFVRDYYPCVAALAQVAFVPEGKPTERTNPRDLPIIMDFSPKKREVYEAVSQTGEAMTRSASGLQVGKGSSTTLTSESSSTEGGSLTAGVTIPLGYVAVGVSGTYHTESGSKSGWSNTKSEVTQVDASREKRESLSHTTELTQMFHELDSYHLGTNRALFVLFPRPHILANELSDEDDALKWVRKLEGIQECFFAVKMPRDNRHVCVEAHLDTMHLRKFTMHVPLPVSDGTEYEEEIDQREWADGRWTSKKHDYFKEVHAPEGFKIDRTKGSGGYDEHVTAYVWCNRTVTVFDSYIQIHIELLDLGSQPADPVRGVRVEAFAQYKATYKLYCMSESVHYVDNVISDVKAFSTGRHLQGCLALDGDNVSVIGPVEGHLDKRIDNAGYVTYELPLPAHLWKKGQLAGTKDDLNRIRQANRLGRELKALVAASANSPDRYPIGEHTIVDTDLAAKALLQSELRAQTSSAVRVPVELHDVLGQRAVATLEQIPLARFIDSPSTRLARDLRVDPKSIIAVKLAQASIPLVHGSETSAGAEKTQN